MPDHVADLFAMVNLTSLTSNYVTLLGSFVVLAVIGLAYTAVTRGTKKGKAAL